MPVGRLGQMLQGSRLFEMSLARVGSIQGGCGIKAKVDIGVPQPRVLSHSIQHPKFFRNYFHFALQMIAKLKATQYVVIKDPNTRIGTKGSASKEKKRNEGRSFSGKSENYVFWRLVREVHKILHKRLRVRRIVSYLALHNLAKDRKQTPIETRDFLNSALFSHLQAKKSCFAERYKFYTSKQPPSEDLEECGARVRGLVRHCGFKNKLDVALRGRFVLGMENANENEKLLLRESFVETVDIDARSRLGAECEGSTSQRAKRYVRAGGEDG
ncbi:hypothetical protein EVAR_36796_1 [Eumeta japonica]|uniref:Uncharacterized protein n=1 Tax=Eumeta variegata TaxID=151549 RepID=A0A4C1WWC4_EUMVA|nr:hypothetical protein EVAR_36796_1 [Eumeta japonica]